MVTDAAYKAQFDEMFKRLFQAMLLASETEVDGERAAFINSEVAVDAMLHLLAAIVESSPDIRTRKDIREATQAIEKRLRLGVEHLRQEYERTGRHLFPSYTAN